MTDIDIQSKLRAAHFKAAIDVVKAAGCPETTSAVMIMGAEDCIVTVKNYHDVQKARVANAVNGLFAYLSRESHFKDSMTLEYNTNKYYLDMSSNLSKEAKETKVKKNWAKLKEIKLQKHLALMEKQHKKKLLKSKKADHEVKKDYYRTYPCINNTKLTETYKKAAVTTLLSNSPHKLPGEVLVNYKFSDSKGLNMMQWAALRKFSDITNIMPEFTFVNKSKKYCAKRDAILMKLGMIPVGQNAFKPFAEMVMQESVEYQKEGQINGKGLMADPDVAMDWLKVATELNEFSYKLNKMFPGANPRVNPRYTNLEEKKKALEEKLKEKPKVNKNLTQIVMPYNKDEVDRVKEILKKNIYPNGLPMTTDKKESKKFAAYKKSELETVITELKATKVNPKDVLPYEPDIKPNIDPETFRKFDKFIANSGLNEYGGYNESYAKFQYILYEHQLKKLGKAVLSFDDFRVKQRKNISKFALEDYKKHKEAQAKKKEVYDAEVDRVVKLNKMARDKIDALNNSVTGKRDKLVEKKKKLSSLPDKVVKPIISENRFDMLAELYDAELRKDTWYRVKSGVIKPRNREYRALKALRKNEDKERKRVDSLNAAFSSQLLYTGIPTFTESVIMPTELSKPKGTLKIDKYYERVNIDPYIEVFPLKVRASYAAKDDQQKRLKEYKNMLNEGKYKYFYRGSYVLYDNPMKLSDYDFKLMPYLVKVKKDGKTEYVVKPAEQAKEEEKWAARKAADRKKEVEAASAKLAEIGKIVKAAELAREEEKERGKKWKEKIKAKLAEKMKELGSFRKRRTLEQIMRHYIMYDGKLAYKEVEEDEQNDWVYHQYPHEKLAADLAKMGPENGFIYLMVIVAAYHNDFEFTLEEHIEHADYIIECILYYTGIVVPRFPEK
jgi:hypothetical protein